jgi:hypothetical protein
MLKVSLRRIKPGHEDRLRKWFKELMDRRDEVRETFRQETVRHEIAYILDDAEGSILVYVVEVEDYEKGRRAFQESRLAIDIEHKDIMAESLGERLSIEPVYECAIESSDGLSS